MTFSPPTPLLPILNLASRPEIYCVTSHKGPPLWSAEFVVIQDHYQGLSPNPAVACGLLDVELQHIHTDHFAPTRRVCRHLLLAFLQAQDQGWSKSSKLQSVWYLPIFICTVLSLHSVRLNRAMGRSLLPSQPPQHWFDRISQFTVCQPKAPVSETAVKH